MSTFFGLISTFVEGTREKPVDGAFFHLCSSWVVLREIDFPEDFRRTMRRDMFMLHKFGCGYPERFLFYVAQENPNNLL